MNVRIVRPLQGGKIKAIASKSQVHRYLICAALADRPVNLSFEEVSEDMIATMDCLRAMGAQIQLQEGGCRIWPIPNQEGQEVVPLYCKESGSTFRFLIPLVGALGMHASFFPEGRLPQRPLTPLYEELVRHGMEMSSQGSVPFECMGLLQSGEYEIPGNVSSQYITGLLFALPLLAGDSVIRVQGELESKAYVDMTLAALRDFGICVHVRDGNYFVPGGQKYVASQEEVRIEGDWSNIAFWMCAGAILEKSKEILENFKDSMICSNLQPDSTQGDREIAEILRNFGAMVTMRAEEGEVEVTSGSLQAITLDARNIPDLVPIVAAVASVAQGTTKIYGAKRLRIKESDRLQSVADTLNRLGAKIIVEEDGLLIEGVTSLQGGRISSHNDHRIAMMAAVAAIVAVGEVVIEGAEAVHKSYPRFWEDYCALGGQITIED